MPLIEAFIPEGALRPEAETRLMKELTDILVSLEGIEPENEHVRAKSVIFLYRPQVFVAGAPRGAPRYRFVPWLPPGRNDAEVRRLVVKAVTEAVARAEGSCFDDVKSRVWVLPSDVACSRSEEGPDGIDSKRILDAFLDEE
ncbi:MAG TPA: hypothetical protein VF103_12175 [Polyangiaceae bacterium]